VDNTLDANGKPKSSFDNVVTQNIMKEDAKSTSDVKSALAKEFTTENKIPNATSGIQNVTTHFYGATLAPIFTGPSAQYNETYYNAVASVSAPSSTVFNAGQIVGKLELYIDSAATGLTEKLDVKVTGGGAAYFYVEDGYIKTKVPSSSFFGSSWVGKNAGRVNLELRDAAGNLITTINGLDFVNH
jgi:hypothetical protein